MEMEEGVLTPISLKELGPRAHTDGNWLLLVPQRLSGSLRLFSCEYHPEGDFRV